MSNYYCEADWLNSRCQRRGPEPSGWRGGRKRGPHIPVRVHVPEEFANQALPPVISRMDYPRPQMEAPEEEHRHQESPQVEDHRRPLKAPMENQRPEASRSGSQVAPEERRPTEAPQAPPEEHLLVDIIPEVVPERQRRRRCRRGKFYF
ncbi:hypothetical protein L596_021924 [Steinernema carpocapsae]|uniref:Uncharacterized protein n=1 Tax=Steinernema carpocapsae TaxID=34508 RepID=A0A4U5MKJ9_STECR|nr:hypothetical protein L596_021924 [Steinernema carpocapsae]